MVVDVHTHMFSERLCPQYWIDVMATYGAQVSGKTPDHVLQRMKDTWFDESGDLLVEDMDRAGIDKSVVFCLDFGLYSGVDDSTNLVQRHTIFARAVSRHSDRLILFGGVDPRRPDAAAFIERAVNEWGIKGIKLWPPAGFYPDRPYCYRLYEACARLGLPIVIHTGLEISPFQGQTTLPTYVDQPACDFPEVTFILAHAGMAWWREAAEISFHRDNVYLDTAYWQGRSLRLGPARYMQEFRTLLSSAGHGKVLFGSDWPTLRTVRKVKPDVWMEIVRNYPRAVQDGVQFSEEEIAGYLGGNAGRVLKLEGVPVAQAS